MKLVDRDRICRGGRPLMAAAFWSVLVSITLASCGEAGSSDDGEVMKVSASMSVIGDLVEQVGGDRVEVVAIVPVGASVETFQPRPSDAGRISEAEVVFQNGLGLDFWLDDLLESAGGGDQTVVELAEGLETIEGSGHGEEHAGEDDHAEDEHAQDHAEDEHAHQHAEDERAHEHAHEGGNPHLWLDVENARVYVEKIRDALAETDPEGADVYRENAEEYLEKLEELDGYIRERAEEIPAERRKLVTFHDAFPYFAGAYGFEPVGVILENPDAEPSSREVAEVVRTIEAEDVPAVFTEPQFNSGVADTIAGETGVEVYELYSDTLVDEEAGATYEAMMRTNIDRIVEGLG